MGGNEVRRNSRRGVRLGLCLAVAAVLGTVGLTTASGASVPTADEGVTGKTITLGFIYPATGVAASISQNGLKAFQARIDRENAKGGVNGRTIKVISRDDASSGANLTAAQDLVENQHVFAVVNESPFAFLSYRWLLDHNVPMIGNGVDGTYYQQKGNEDILSSTGNGNPFGDLTYDFPARIMKQLGVKKVGVLAYGAASSSVASAKALMNYAVPEVGLDPAYTNTSIDFGSSDVGAPVLGIKNAGADGVYLPMAAATNVAVAQGLQQNGVNMKAVIMGTGYGQDFLDSPRGEGAARQHVFWSATAGGAQGRGDQAVPGRPEEVRDVTGVPDYGMYTGYILADYAIAAMQKAGQGPDPPGPHRRRHGIGQYDQAGLACQPVDVSLGGLGKVPTTACALRPQADGRQVRLFPEERQAGPAEAGGIGPLR